MTSLSLCDELTALSAPTEGVHVTCESRGLDANRQVSTAPK